MTAGYTQYKESYVLYNGEVEAEYLVVKAIRGTTDRSNPSRINYYEDPVEVSVVKCGSLVRNLENGDWLLVDPKDLQALEWPYTNPPQYKIHVDNVHGRDVCEKPNRVLYKALPYHDHEFEQLAEEHLPDYMVF